MSTRYLVIGLGITGQSVLRYCQREKIPAVAYDTRGSLANIDTLKAQYPLIDFYLKTFPTERLSEFTTVVVSPGVSLDHPLIQEAKVQGLPVIGDVELFAQVINKPVIAITGTNGKSTVTRMVGDIMLAAGKKVAVCGNIGKPVLDTLLVSYDVWVLELSSFQLDTVFSLKPKVACILNVAPDHLDRHHDFNAYVLAKHRIYHDAEAQVYCLSDPNTSPKSEAKKVSFSLCGQSDYRLVETEHTQMLAIKDQPLMPTSDLKVKGQHNLVNALAATAITHTFGISPTVIKQALSAFSGLDHRCQWVKEENEVGWINDSKGTNVGAAIAAISGLGPCIKGKLIWIAGGQGKGADFSPLAEPVQTFASLAILMGEDKEKIAHALKENTKIRYVNSMAEAISLAKQHAMPGDCVLLSPACASFDMFDSFVHRGDVFMKTVLAS